MVMVMNHAHHTFEPKYILDYRVLKVLNDSTLLLTMLNEKERKTKIIMLHLQYNRACRKCL